jgi:uncharacterized protein YdeI (YjbR/CyaY-like superfamily)
MSGRGAAIQNKAKSLLWVEMPSLLARAFDGDKKLRAWAGTLRPSWQRYIAQWIMEPKSDEAKQRRADGMAERMLLTMEAEEELPGFLARRLKGTRDAWAGWERMTHNRRRDLLFILFAMKSEAAREKQIVRLVEAAVEKGRAKARPTDVGGTKE